ncbi:MAG: hypothetical protein E5V33_17015, partial [Mesorhizobium sp.]
MLDRVGGVSTKHGSSGRDGKTTSLQHLEKWTDWLCDDKAGPLNAALAFAVIYCLVQVVVMTLSSHWA